MVSRSSILLGPILTPRALRAFAASVFVCALAMPWLAWWMGAFGEAREVVEPERVVEYRPAMVALPGGKFWMGSTVKEQSEARWEFPTTSVKHPRKSEYLDEKRHEAEVEDFELCRTEVTQEQWKAVMGMTELEPEECGNETCDDEKPITDVTWFEAVEYLNRLTEKENERRGEGEKWTVCYRKVTDDKVEWDRTCSGYRLPTEAEWEYAARAGSETAYFFGDDASMLCEYGNVADYIFSSSSLTTEPVFQAQNMGRTFWIWSNAKCEDGAVGTARVGNYKPNAWGLYDTHGNVWEWTWNLHEVYRINPPKNYAGPETGDLRALRGGSYLSGPEDLRTACRLGSKSSEADSSFGLRCARGPHPQR